METFDKNQFVENLLSSATNKPAGKQYTFDEIYEMFSKLTPEQKIETLFDALTIMNHNPSHVIMDSVFYSMGFDFDYTNQSGKRIYTKNREGIDY